jgi:hypothetical protein
MSEVSATVESDRLADVRPPNEAGAQRPHPPTHRVEDALSALRWWHFLLFAVVTSILSASAKPIKSLAGQCRRELQGKVKPFPRHSDARPVPFAALASDCSM